MEVDRKDLREILSMLRPGLSNREMSGQACHFIFFENEIVTYNDTICISHPYESDALFSVKGEEFFKLIDGITDDNITIEVKNKFVHVTSESTSSRIAALPDEKNTNPEAIESIKESMKDWHPVPEGFLEGIGLCAFSVSPDLTKGTYACVGIIGDKCWGIELYRSSAYTMKSKVKERFFIIGKQAEELVKFPITEYCLSDNWIHFRTDKGVTCSCKRVSGKFDFQKSKEHFEVVEKLKSVSLPEGVKEAVDNIIILASDLSDRSGKLILLNVLKDRIEVEGSNELGWVKKTIPFKYSGDPINIKMNSKFLSQILSRSTKLAVKEDVVYFHNGPFQHIIMQVRV